MFSGGKNIIASPPQNNIKKKKKNPKLDVYSFYKYILANGKGEYIFRIIRQVNKLPLYWFIKTIQGETKLNDTWTCRGYC